MEDRLGWREYNVMGLRRYDNYWNENLRRGFTYPFISGLCVYRLPTWDLYSHKNHGDSGLG